MGVRPNFTQAMRPTTRRPSTTDDVATRIDRPGPDRPLRAATPAPPTLDELWGGYAIFEQLGSGGMAVVHRAECRQGGARRRVALKRLHPHAARDPELVASFLREAKVVSRLQHRHIAEVYDFGRHGDDYFLAMELVAGPSMNDLLRCCSATVGQIPFPITLKLLSEICEALAYVHSQTDGSGNPLGLIHRDISPSNVVISSNGIVKLIDFGIAKTSGSNTQVGIIKGKLGYVAPEYIAGTLDHRADLWAVGVVAWELLTGRRLFKAEDDFTTLKQVQSMPIEPPSSYNSDVPPELEAIVMTALHRDPASRWQNASALRNALLGVARPSTNSDLVEWVDWVFGMFGRGERPPRGSRPLQPQKARAFVVTPSVPDVDVARAATIKAIPTFTPPNYVAPPPLVGVMPLGRRSTGTFRVAVVKQAAPRRDWPVYVFAWLMIAALSAALFALVQPDWLVRWLS
jgi:serine/threonine protein kinase